jgi:glycosyltransferase involved in cell wall biosynthesis
MDTTLSVTAIIPALNEEATIAGVIRAVPSESVSQVIVVDNGSTDRTGQIAQDYGAWVVSEPVPGYGRACFAGLKAARNFEILVFLDGDGADDPAQIPVLVELIQSQQADLVIGSRMRGKSEPGAILPHARFGNWLTSQMMRYLYGTRVTDLGPFRAVRREVLDRLDMQEMTYGWPTEMLVKAARLGYRIAEVPVDYRRRAGGVSKVSGTLRGSVLAAYSIIGTTLKYARYSRGDAAVGNP